jgi:hypothetical protein
MRLLVWIALAALAAVTLIAYRAYDSVGMLVAWDRLLAFCGH